MRKVIVDRRALAGIALGVVGLAGVGMNAQAKDDDNDHVVKDYDFAGFDSIDVSAVHTLDIRLGGDFSVRTEASAENAKWSEVRLSGDTLILGRTSDYKNGYRRNESKDQSVRVFITMPDLTELDTSGVTKGEVSGFSGGDLEIDTSGVTELVLRGTCASLELDTSGVANIDATALKCERVEADGSGVSKVKVHASQRIDADVSGMSKIWVYGDPAERHESTSHNSRVIFE